MTPLGYGCTGKATGGLLELARDHLGDGAPGLQDVRLGHAAAEGALDLVEHGEEPEHDEGEQGDGDEDFEEGEGAKRAKREA